MSLAVSKFQLPPNSYLTVLVDLWGIRMEKERGVNVYSTPRTTQASALINALVTVKQHQGREAFVDRGRGR